MTQLLVVDDDPSVLRLVSLVLHSEDIEVQTATNGVEALEVLGEQTPDLILLDLAMPEMDGRTFYRLARRSGYDGPVVIFSAFEANTARRELGAQACIEKPFEPETLVELVKDLLDKTSV